VTCDPEDLLLATASPGLGFRLGICRTPKHPQHPSPHQRAMRWPGHFAEGDAAVLGFHGDELAAAIDRVAGIEVHGAPGSLGAHRHDVVKRAVAVCRGFGLWIPRHGIDERVGIGRRLGLRRCQERREIRGMGLDLLHVLGRRNAARVTPRPVGRHGSGTAIP